MYLIYVDESGDSGLNGSPTLYFVLSAPSAYMRKKSGQNYFKRLDPVLCRQASPWDTQGIIRL